MQIGTKSLLFGIHQVFVHPYVVRKAWKYLYGKPTWKEMICIIIHDWGYWGKPNLDGPEGETHPELGAKIAGMLFGPEYRDLCYGHSRTYSKLKGIPISKLCWADKLSFCFETRKKYLKRARKSGEIIEIYKISITNGLIQEKASLNVWYQNMWAYCKNQPEIKNIMKSPEFICRDQDYLYYSEMEE